jgi:hypothetical protein
VANFLENNAASDILKRRDFVQIFGDWKTVQIIFWIRNRYRKPEPNLFQSGTGTATNHFGSTTLAEISDRLNTSSEGLIAAFNTSANNNRLNSSPRADHHWPDTPAPAATANDTDDFGDFGDFVQPPLPPPVSSLLAGLQLTPLPSSLPSQLLVNKNVVPMENFDDDEWSLPSSSSTATTTTTSQQQLAPTMFEAAAPRISSVSPILPYLSASPPPPPTDGGFVVPPMMTSSPPPPTAGPVNYNGRVTAAVGRLEEEEFELPSDQFQLSDQVRQQFFGVPVSVGDPGPDPDPSLFS